MSTRLLVMGSIMAVGAAASLLLFKQSISRSPISILPAPSTNSSTQINQSSSRSPISILPTPFNNSSTQTFKNKKDVLPPLLPSLTKFPTSTAGLSPKNPQLESNLSSQILATPTITSVKPKQFIPNILAKSALQKALPIITPTINSPLSSKRFVSTGEAELSTSKPSLVFTHRSRPIVPPIDYPNVPTESIATPMPIAETPTPTPLKPLAIPMLIQLLATPTPTIPTNLLATPTPIQATPIISPSPDQPTP